MRKKTKASGTSFENRVKRHLEKLGWKMFRSAGSKSCADLLAFGRVDDFDSSWALWIQCKASPTPSLTMKEKNELHAGQKFYGATALVVCRENLTWKFLYYMFEGQTSKLVEVEEPAWLTE